MKSKILLPIPRKDPFENRSSTHLDPSIVRSIQKYRNSLAVDFRQRDSPQGWNRYSFNIGCNVKARSQEGGRSMHKMQSIRETLNQLQLRIESAKQKLKGNIILGRSVIEEEDQEQSRTLDLISFNDSQHSQQTVEHRGISGRPQVQKKQLQLVDLNRVKTYYLSELAKIFNVGNPRAKQHIVHLWQVLNENRRFCDPNPQIYHKHEDIGEKTDRKTLVIGLDGVLLHCDSQKRSQQDIQISLPKGKGCKQSAYLTIRPHAISFLKKMGKKFDVVIFSKRSKEETDLILDELDPLAELISHKLYKDSCFKIGNSEMKDLRVLKKDLSSVIIVDSDATSFPLQINNAVPLLPFRGGTDSELYILQKYLQELWKSKDIREPNGRYFQLFRWLQWEQALQGVMELYFSRE